MARTDCKGVLCQQNQLEPTTVQLARPGASTVPASGVYFCPARSKKATREKVPEYIDSR